MGENKSIYYQTFVITGLYLIASLIGILHHEPWRDEVQAWFIATRSNTLSDLFENCRYEGHPLTWHFILFCVSKFSVNILSMQVVSILIATISVWLFCFYSPFTWYQKWLFPFGYLTLFQYGIVARSYGLILFFSLLYIIWLTRSNNKPWGWVILFLLASISASGIALALALVCFYLLKETKTISFRGLVDVANSHKIGLLTLGFSILLSLWQIFPETDNIIGGDLSFKRFSLSIASLADSYTWVSYWPTLDSWSGVFWNDPGLLLLLASLMLFLIFCWLFFTNPLTLFFYFFGTMGLAFLFSSTMMISARFIGHFYIVLVISLWLFNQNYGPSLSGFQWISTIQLEKMRHSIFTFILSCQFITGVWAYQNDYKQSYSNTKAVAQFLLENNYSALPITGAMNYTISPLAYYLNQDIYYLEGMNKGSFMIWEKSRFAPISMDKLCQFTDSILTQHDSGIVILSTFLPTAIPIFKKLEEHQIDCHQVTLTLLKKFEGAIVKDENYYVYLATKKKL